MKDLLLTDLYDIYGSLLSDKQRGAFELYFGEDLSLSEISEHTGTSRQGVRDLTERASEELRGFEQKLGLYGFRKRAQALYNEISGELSPSSAEKLKALLDL